MSYDALSNEKIATGKGVEKEAISIALTVLFEVPKFVCPPGTAEHWALDDAEEKSLIERIQDVIAMLPKAKRTRAMKFIGKIMPPLALGVTAYMITKPRVDLTRTLMKTNTPLPKGPNASLHATQDTRGANGASGNTSADVGGPAAHGDPGIATNVNGTNGRARRSALDDSFAGVETFH